MKYLTILLLMFIAVACSTSDKAVEVALEDLKKGYKSESARIAANLDFENYRTQLSDAYAYRENEIPEVFNRKKVEQEEEKNLYEGYRIQIYSGQNVVEADTTAANFRVWADTTIVGYTPDTYVFFRTPYYRVHVGDFHERDRAINFSNIVKRYFKDAWVVYDKVVPAKVPSDTVAIETK